MSDNVALYFMVYRRPLAYVLWLDEGLAEGSAFSLYIYRSSSSFP